MTNKRTYEEIKSSGEGLRIADWFSLSDKTPSYPWHVIGDAREDFYIERETEKAIKVVWEVSSADGEYERTWSSWVPKAAIESLKEYNERRNNAFENGCKKYDALINFCKENHVKGARVGLRTKTLLNMIAKAGLTYAAA